MIIVVRAVKPFDHRKLSLFFILIISSSIKVHHSTEYCMSVQAFKEHFFMHLQSLIFHDHGKCLCCIYVHSLPRYRARLYVGLSANWKRLRRIFCYAFLLLNFWNCNKVTWSLKFLCHVYVHYVRRCLPWVFSASFVDTARKHIMPCICNDTSSLNIYLHPFRKLLSFTKWS